MLLPNRIRKKKRCAFCIYQSLHSSACAYVKLQWNKADVDKLSKKAKLAINRLADFRQPFVFCLIPLFSETGESLYEENPTAIADKLFLEKQGIDEQSFLNLAREYAASLEDAGSTFKRKVLFSGNFQCKVTEVGDSHPINTVDPSLIPLKCPDNIDQSNPGDSVRVTCCDCHVLTSCINEHRISLFVAKSRICSFLMKCL